MDELISDARELYIKSDRKTDLEHCFYKLLESVNKLNDLEHAYKYGLNLGRAQEILGTKYIWHNHFKPKTSGLVEKLTDFIAAIKLN